MFALMAIGIPIFVSIGLAAYVGLALIFGPVHAMVDFTSFLWQSVNNFELVTIPLFVLTAMLVEESKIGDELFNCAKAWIGAVPNGLGVAVVLTCAVFASITGSSPVTAVTVGLIALPALAREGYPDSLRGALIAGGGTLGILLPPSLPLIIYGVLTQTSIGSLFMATVIPGLLLMLMFAIYVIVFHKPAGPLLSMEATRMSDPRLWLAGLVALPALVIGASTLRIRIESLRRLAVISATGMVLAALVIALSAPLRDFSIRTSALTSIPGGEDLIRIDTLSGALLPHVSTETMAALGAALATLGLCGFGYAFAAWMRVEFGNLTSPMIPRLVMGGLTLTVIGLQTFFAAFLLGTFAIPHANRS